MLLHACFANMLHGTNPQIDDKTPMTTKSPMEFIAETEPIKVEGLVVASTGCAYGVHGHTRLVGLKAVCHCICTASVGTYLDVVNVYSYTADDPRLGCPVEYINLKGTSYDKPAVCKYTGNKYYSDAWRKYGIKE